MKKQFETTYCGRQFSVDVFLFDKKKAVESGAVTEQFTEQYSYLMQIYLAVTNKLIESSFLTTAEFDTVSENTVIELLKDVDPNSFIPVLNPDEPTDITVKWHDENWIDKKTSTKKILLSECKIYQRGNFIIIEVPGGKVAYREHVGQYCYILDAIQYMMPETPGTWKTLDKLTTFRQAIRECAAQGMGLEDMYQIDRGISQEQYKEFIKVARVYDKRHHHAITF